MKSLNGDLQMRPDWLLPICTGSERLKDDEGNKIHPTQKPESLLNRIIMSSSRIGDIVRSIWNWYYGCSGKKTKRKFIGIEESLTYIKKAQKDDGTFPSAR